MLLQRIYYFFFTYYGQRLINKNCYLSTTRFSYESNNDNFFVERSMPPSINNTTVLRFHAVITNHQVDVMETRVINDD